MSSPLRVFVSSTSRDLDDYRKAVIEALFYMGQPMSIMERFGSRSAGGGRVSNGEVSTCGVLIGIYAYRYGYVPDEEAGAQAASITEGEFDTAQRCGLQCLCYFASPVLEAELTTPEPDWKRQRQARFKERIDRTLVRAAFTSPANLAGLIVADLDRILRGDPIGYSDARMRAAWRRYQHDEFARLAGECWHRPFDLVASPLKEIWSEYVNSPLWHDHIAGSLAVVRDTARRHPGELAALEQCAAGVDVNAPYATALNGLQSFLYSVVDRTLVGFAEVLRQRSSRLATDAEINGQSAELRKLRQAVRHLQREARDPRFGRCFLVIGRAGSGRTHFIASILNEDEDRDESVSQQLALVLWPNDRPPAVSVRDFEAMLADAIRAATGMRGWRSVEQFAGFARDTRLVIVIDELARWLVGNPQFLTVLTGFIAAHAAIPSLRFVITLQTTDYDRVSEASELSRFWQAYGFNREYRLGRRSQRQVGGVRFESPVRPDPAVTGWLVLDDLNRSAGIGRSILRAQLEQEGLDVSSALLALDEGAASASHIAIPLIVWIFLDARREFGWDVLVNFTFIDFIERFWQQTAAALVPAVQETLAAHASGARARIVLDRIVVLVAAQLAARPELAPEFDGLVRRIAEASDDVALTHCEIVASVLGALEQGNLVHRVRSEILTTGWPTERLELFFELFWAYRLALNLLARIVDTGKLSAVAAARDELEPWFRQKGAASLHEGAFEFLLLALPKHLVELRKADAGFLIDLCRLALRLEQLPSAPVWFAGVKGTREFQQALVVLAGEEGTGGGRRALFAFITFVGEVGSDVIDPQTRLSLLRPHYGKIGELGLDQYFVYVVARLLSELNADGSDVRLLACLEQLAGCEATGRAEEVAVFAVETLGAQARDDIHAMLKSIRTYLKRSGEQATDDYRQSGRKKWERRFFREWVLQKFCRSMIQSPSAYDVLIDYRWYSPAYHSIVKSIGIEMEREANLGFSALYRLHAVNVRDFIKLVSELTVSGYKADRRNAVFIIKHTEWTGGEGKILVAKEFHPFLEKLFMDLEIADTVDNNYGLFCANLSDFPKREEMRRSAMNDPAPSGGLGEGGLSKRSKLRRRKRR
jgi:Domain of unknown function (DUF4062)